ncbi:MAG: hypothetical protein KAT34_12230, partial [Candidatus Aminicenantes bacterium]|nr:hypothetical protein [Candidatus Aminicenantes bacterium]
KRYEELIGVIKNESNKNLQELAVNPLLLTIIAIVHRTRAVLPRDRYKLFEECLKVMIELWNLSNRKLDVSFSFENSMAQLSKIAVHLMESESRELDKAEIEKCGLPATIENQLRDFFLKEMVLKAGLLYESEGKYGFLHLTFQEYLTAYYYSHSKNQNEILNHHDKDYWQETFKLFVNIGNAEVFFQEIIDDLIKKEYWKHISLWEDCLNEIVCDDTRETIELNFARKVIDIILKLENKKENDIKLDTLFRHYPLYYHAGSLINESWYLFYNAIHPIAKFISASILYRGGDRSRGKLLIILKQNIFRFERELNQSRKEKLYFLLKNFNSFVLLVWSLSLPNFYFTLSKLKSSNLFLPYLIIPDFSDLLYFLEFWDLHTSSEPKLFRIFKDVRAILILFGLKESHVIRIFRTIRDLSNFIELKNLCELIDFRSLKGLRQHGLISYLRGISENFDKKYALLLRKHQIKIHEWTTNAIMKLHGLSDKRLLDFFPNTTETELKEFREGYVAKT